MTNYSNIAVDTTLNGAITAASTSLTVASATGYPTVPFNIQIDTEVIRVGEVATLVFKGLDRGYDGTSGSTHANSADVQHVVIAEDVRSISTVPQYVTDLAVRPGTAHAYDDEFDDDSIHADWTELTVSGTSTWSEDRGRLLVEADSITASDTNPILKALDSLTSPLTIETRVTPSTERTTYWMYGLMFSDGVTSTDNMTCCMPFTTTTGGTITNSFRSGTHTNIATLHGEYPIHGAGAPMYLRLIWSAANSFKYMWSFDGQNWLAHTNNTVSRTLTPTYFGLHATTWGSTAVRLAAFDYFRVTESDLSL